jgi:uncharacterized membrane protein YvbJ
MYCSNCGKKIEDNYKYCEYCGHKIINDNNNDKIKLKNSIINGEVIKNSDYDFNFVNNSKSNQVEEFNKEERSFVNKKMKRNEMCTYSFVLGLISIILFNIFWIPFLSIVIGIMGISKVDVEKENNKWMGIAGLTLGVIFLIDYVYINLKY